LDGRMELGPMLSMRAGPMLGGPTIHRRRGKRLLLANRTTDAGDTKCGPAQPVREDILE
jgi:hypothetical protein